MLHALAQAKQGDYCFGCVIVQGNRIIASANNTVKTDRDPLAHAEIKAIRLAVAELGITNLETCTIYTTVEPCPMCMGAIILAKVGRLVYGASTEELKSLAPVIAVSSREIAAHAPFKIEVIGGILSDDCLMPFRK